MARSRVAEGIMVLLCLSSPGATSTLADSLPGAQGVRTTIEGEILPISCTVEKANGRTRYSDCDVNCKAKDNAVGLADTRGRIYVLLNGKSGSDFKDGLKKQNRALAITGRLVEEEDGSSPVIYVEMVR